MLLAVVSFSLTLKLYWAVWRARQVRPWLDVMSCYIRRTEQSCCKWKDRLDVEVKKIYVLALANFFFCTKLFLIPVALITWTVILEYLAKKFKQKANLEPFFWRVEGCAIYTFAKILINKSSSFSELATSCILALTVPGLKWLVHSIILQLASCNSRPQLC